MYSRHASLLCPGKSASDEASASAMGLEHKSRLITFKHSTAYWRGKRKEEVTSTAFSTTVEYVNNRQKKTRKPQLHSETGSQLYSSSALNWISTKNPEPRMPHLDRVLSLALDGTDIQITSRSFFPVAVRTTTY